jgi:hypothetical protein
VRCRPIHRTEQAMSRAVHALFVVVLVASNVEGMRVNLDEE